MMADPKRFIRPIPDSFENVIKAPMKSKPKPGGQQGKR